MKKKILIVLTIAFLLFFSFQFNNKVEASNYLSDKTEILIELDVAGAETLCQTDDGFVWIGQYSGLTRYDSSEFVTFKNFEENGVNYDIINVRALAQKNNILYIVTNKNVFKYENNKFSVINLDLSKASSSDVIFYDIEVASDVSLLYISSNRGLIIYDYDTKFSYIDENTIDKNVNDVALYPNAKKFYYLLNDGVYQNGNVVYSSNYILDIYIYKDVLLICTTTGLLRFDLINNKLFDNQYEMIQDQINKVIYSPNDEMIIVAAENKGLYCIEEKTGDYTVTGNFKNSKQLIDLLIDYENNLWVASHNVTSTGVSIITKNALFNLFYDDEVWKTVPNQQVSAVEKYNNTIYIASKSGLFCYDLTTEKIVNDSGDAKIIMDAIKQYLEDIGKTITIDFRDIELFNNKLYFAVYGIGLVEYNQTTKAVNIYGDAFINDSNNIEKINGEELTTIESLLNVRCLRAFDNFLAAGYQSGGVVKFNGEKISVYHTGRSVLFINKTADNRILVDQTNDLFIISSDFESKEIIPTEKNVEGSRLKFLVDDNKIYYNLNSKLFCFEKNGDEYKNYEIIIPHVKGSIVEISKVKINKSTYKYVIATQSQIYVFDSFDEKNLDSYNTLKNYELFDSTNGVEEIPANSSGFYDEETKKYYFQTTEGVFVYDFNYETDGIAPLKVAMTSIDVDGEKVYDNKFNISRYTKRIEFNLSVLGFRPNKGYTIYYKLNGVDTDFVEVSDSTKNISYTNLMGGNYTFTAYVIDEFGNSSNVIEVTFAKTKFIYEYSVFWVIIIILAILLFALINYLLIRNRIKKAIKRENEYKAITLEAIEAIARTIDAKDSYTNGHSKRVGIYSREIARALELSENEIENIYYIALLHDIGKIAIPENILNKPGRLTDEEFAIMKSHTTAGAKILESISTIPNIVAGAKYHHEKYGGGGYPTGIKGEEIPLVARIICCADCYDAMATKRVYKDPYSKEKIISEFERCKETQFDPKIADIVIKLIKEDRLRYGTEKNEEDVTKTK